MLGVDSVHRPPSKELNKRVARVFAGQIPTFVAGNYNAENILWGYRLVNQHGRRLAEAIVNGVLSIYSQDPLLSTPLQDGRDTGFDRFEVVKWPHSKCVCRIKFRALLTSQSENLYSSWRGVAHQGCRYESGELETVHLEKLASVTSDGIRAALIEGPSGCVHPDRTVGFPISSRNLYGVGGELEKELRYL